MGVGDVMSRSASMTSSDILSSLDDGEDSGVLDEIIQKCYHPLPNLYFSTEDFVGRYLFLCDEMCMFYALPTDL